MKQKNKTWLVLVGAFLLLFFCAIVALMTDVQRRKKAQEEYSNISTNVISTENEDKKTQVEGEEKTTEQIIESQLGIVIPEKNFDWEALYAQNKDIYAWIYVPGTSVDYPVLQHPSDDSYYLNYNLDGSKGFPGCIYTEATYTSKDFTDPNTVIYGHNLKDKTMFTSLHNFEDADFFSKSDHYIFIYTQEKVFVYQIFAAYEYPSIHLLDNYDFTNQYVYADYLEEIFHANGRVVNLRDDVEVTTEDRIVTLSTCTRDSNDKLRFLVTGVLLNPGE